MKIKEEIFREMNVIRMENEYLVMLVCPEDGMNIYSIEYKGQPIVVFDDERQKEGRTFSVPILYPTPNRIENGKFLWAEKEYQGVMHGCTKNANFRVVQMTVKDNQIILEAQLDWKKGTEYYSVFPFDSILSIRIILDKEQIHYKYTVENLDEKELPYGFAVHPFFVIEDNETSFIVNADSVMEMNEEQLPTGSLIAVQNTKYDLHKETSVASHRLDHVYTNLSSKPMAKVRYRHCTMELNASEVFTHMVVFTPNDKFFCLENQTCSTDSHNLFNKGFVKESGLQIVQPKKKESGEIIFSFCSIEA